jgi:hypothetical protein
MYSLPTRRQLGLGVLLAVMTTAGSVIPAAAQGSRMRVLVPAFEVDNPRSRLGVQLAEQLRRQINQMPTHAPADARQVRNALRRFDLREEQTSCAQWLQLAEHVEAGLVLCGTVEESSQRVTARFLAPAATPSRCRPSPCSPWSRLRCASWRRSARTPASSRCSCTAASTSRA